MTSSRRDYKALSLQELQCLSETARLGSLSAAAQSLGLSYPTVWKQVHALEQIFGTKLVEPHARGCKLTSAGNRLVEVVGPAVESIRTARERFQSELSDDGIRLTIAVTPRMVTEDFAQCVARFQPRFPKASFQFLEMLDDDVAPVVHARRADFGFTASQLTQEQEHFLVAELLYNLEVRLVTQANHPLARRRSVHPRDLRGYPLMSGPVTLNSHIRGIMDQHQVCLAKVQANLASSVRHFVLLGWGIGIVPGSVLSPRHPDLHERSMSHHFGYISIYLIRRRGGFMAPLSEEFIDLARRELQI
jgi:molybdate transport repressor ModE-like protein